VGVEERYLFGQSCWERDVVGIEASDISSGAMMQAVIDCGRDAGIFLVQD